MFCALAYAHSLKGFASEENGEIVVKSYFYGSSPCRGCEVSVILEDGQAALRLKTDESGYVRFAPPASKFEIRINGGLGHEKRFKFESVAASNLDSNLNGDKANDNSNLNISDFAKFASALAIIGVFFGALWLAKRPRKALVASNLNKAKDGGEA